MHDANPAGRDVEHVVRGGLRTGAGRLERANHGYTSTINGSPSGTESVTMAYDITFVEPAG